MNEKKQSAQTQPKKSPSHKYRIAVQRENDDGKGSVRVNKVIKGGVKQRCSKAHEIASCSGKNSGCEEQNKKPVQKSFWLAIQKMNKNEEHQECYDVGQ